MLNRFSRVQLFATAWTVACQAPLPLGFSRQEYWSGLPCPPPTYPPNPGIEPLSLKPPALAGQFFTTPYPNTITLGFRVYCVNLEGGGGYPVHVCACV